MSSSKKNRKNHRKHRSPLYIRYMYRHYSNNVVYVLLMDNINFYVGCHSNDTQEYLTEGRILSYSGNILRVNCSPEEYHNRVKLLLIEEYDTKEEAENREEELIERFKELLGDRCLNVMPANKYMHTQSRMYEGYEHTQETQKRKENKNSLPGGKFYKKRQELFSLLHTEEISVVDAAKRVGVNHQTAYNWLHRYSIEFEEFSENT